MGTASETPVKLNDAVYESLSWWGEFFRTKVKDIMTEYGSTVGQNKALKDAGASYQKRLTAAHVTLDTLSSPHAQAVLSGVFMFDATYAAVFLKMNDAVIFMGNAQELSRLAGITLPMTHALTMTLADPNQMADSEAWQSVLDAGLENDRQVVLFVDQLYGSIIEGLYVVTESIVQNDYAPELMAYADTQHTNLQVLIKLFGIFQDDPAFSALLNLNRRLRIIEDINSTMAFDQVSRQKVDQIRELVVPIRNAILEGRAE